MIKRSLLLINGVPSLALKADKIAGFFSDPDELLSATKAELETVPFITAREAELFFERKDEGFADREIERALRCGCSILDMCGQEYPALLKEISSPPPVLYVRGDPAVLSGMCVAIVGTRLPTLYGIEMSGKFASGLAALGVVVVSGLARGVDTAAHTAAVKSGTTVAVLGSGLAAVYPRENTGLAADIAEKGAVVSEFPLSAPPLREHFPRRNRIISGLCRGIVVVEASLRSGSLITARCALEQNREVFAVPGKADSPVSRGAHLLIKQGAKLAESLEDILEELQIYFDREDATVGFAPEEKALFEMFEGRGMCMEELVQRSSLQREAMHKALLSLQLKGIVKEVRPSYFTKVTI